MTLVTRKTLYGEQFEREQEIRQMVEMMKAKNRHDQERESTANETEDGLCRK